MKIHAAFNKPAITIESVVEFKPWPFAEDSVRMEPDVGYWYPGTEPYSGSSENDGDNFMLTRCDDTLVTLSDGRRYVTEHAYIPDLPAMLASLTAMANP